MAPATEEVEEVVLFAVDDDGVGTITINRPSSLNSLSVPVFERLKEIATAVRYEKEIKVLILTGAGDRAFSADMRRDDLQKGQNSEFLKTGGKAERIDSPLPRRRRTESRLLSVEEKLLRRRWRPRARGGGRCAAARRDSLLEHPETPRIGQKTARKVPEMMPKNP